MEKGNSTLFRRAVSLLDSMIGVDYHNVRVGPYVEGKCNTWGRSSVGLERRPVTPEVAGSSPVAPAITVASLRLF